MAKILVIRFSSIGDIVLASPVLRCIKKQLPDTELHFVTKKSFSLVSIANPYVDRFFYYDDNMDELLLELKAENYDYVVDLHKNFRSRLIRRSLKKKAFVIDKLTVQKFLLTQFNINIMPKRHITQRSLDTVKPLGVTDDGAGLDYFIPAGDRIQMSDIPVAHSLGYIAIAIGASYETKKLPLHKLQELCKKIDHPIILLGGKEDAGMGEMIAAQNPTKIYNACGKFNLNESADLIRRSRLVISHDTGLQYIACAFNKPVIAIWGGTSPKLDVEPYYGTAFSGAMPPYENIFLNLRCQPCSKYGTRTCPLGHFNCMEKQDIDAIVQRVNFRLRSALLGLSG